MNFKFIDLFSGLGGIRIGFEGEGFNCVFSSEIDKTAREIYKENWDEEPAGDIRGINVDDIPDHDVLCAGFPCQPFSIAGKRKGFEDERSDLFYDIIRVLQSKKPSMFLLENVKNLLTMQNGKVFTKMLDILRKVGYECISYQVLNTKTHANIPQNRERLFIVGSRIPAYFEWCDKIPLTKTVYDIVEGSWDLEYKDLKEYYVSNSKSKALKSALAKVSENSCVNDIIQWRRSYVRKLKGNVCPALTSNMGKGGHNIPLILWEHGWRKITPAECFDFQGFPSWYDYFSGNWSNSKLYSLIGNSVTVPIITRLAQRFNKTLKQIKGR